MNWLDKIYDEFSEYIKPKNLKLNINNHEKVDVYDWALDSDINPDFDKWAKEIGLWSEEEDEKL